jgi:hypothetical protein
LLLSIIVVLALALVLALRTAGFFQRDFAVGIVEPVDGHEGTAPLNVAVNSVEPQANMEIEIPANAASIGRHEASHAPGIIRIGEQVCAIEWNGNLRRLRFPTGAIKAEEVINDGKLDGPATMWHSNGQLHAQGLYHANREEGFWVYYSENGLKIAEGSFVSGQREGPWTTWFDDGTMESQGSYLAGKRTGAWVFWSILGGATDGDKTGFYLEGRKVPH